MQLYNDIRVGNISIVVQKEDNSDFYFNCHSRAGYGFIFVLDGSGTYSDASGKYSIQKHSVMILQKDDSYFFKAGENGITYITTAFNVEPVNSFRELGLPTCINAEKHPYILKQAKDMLNVWESRSPRYIMETRVIIEHLLLDLIGICENPASGFQFGGRLAPALTYINQNYDKPLSNEELADLCELSSTHFRRLFKEQIGTSPMQYRETIRLHWAIKFLESQMFTISEVAENLGYSDIYHFSKVIKKHTGNPPSFYKR